MQSMGDAFCVVERRDGSAGGVFGTLTAISPLTVTVRGTKLTSGLFYPAGTVFRKEDIGWEVAHDFS